MNLKERMSAGLSQRLISGEEEILPPNPVYQHIVKRNWDQVAKPLDSLGVFEDITVRMGGILEDTSLNLDKKAILVMCADNGIVEEGVSQSGQEVTLAVAGSMGRQTSSVCRMARLSKAAVIPVDIGIHSDEILTGVLSCKVAHGTRNFAKEPAMTREEVYQAVEVGIDLVRQCKEEGFKLIGTGEMGIGNTTTSAAVIASLLSCLVHDVVGRGAGLSSEGLDRKRQVIEEAIARYQLQDADALTVLQCVGGLDIAGLVGVMFGGAYYQIPIVLDGVISAAAALAAVRILPAVKDYLFASHMGKEQAMGPVCQELGLKPVIYGELALGEGTGAAMFFSLLDQALSVYHDQTTFGDIQIEAYARFQ